MTARPALAAIAVLIAFPAGLPSLTPDDALWDSAVEWIAKGPKRPEDAGMGPLADLRNPDPAWASALEVCRGAFAAVRGGTVPEEAFLGRMRPLLVLEFKKVLGGGGLDVRPRYGLPSREGERVSVPVRLEAADGPEYGFIYLVRSGEGEWFIDQWALDLTGQRPVREAF